MGLSPARYKLTDFFFLLSSLRLEQIARLRSELDVVRGNTKVMSEMLTEMVPGQEDSSDLELLQVRALHLREALGLGMQQ